MHRQYLNRRTPSQNDRCLRVEPLEDRRMLAVITVSNLADAGEGSLRAAITAANETPGADTIDFSVTGTIHLLSSNLPRITQELHIEGPGASELIIDAGPSDSYIFRIDDSSFTQYDVSISDLTLTGIQNDNGVGGAIANSKTLTVQRCVIRDNLAYSGAGIHNGNRGVLLVQDSTLSGNVGAYGGGIASYGSVQVINSTLSGNRATYSGGAIFFDGQLLTIAHSTLSGNQGGNGGGIFHGFGLFSLTNTIVANSPSGGDIYIAPEATIQGSHNLVEDGSDGLSDTIVGDPRLGPLVDDGGPTDTHAPLYGSPVINAGDPGATAGSGGVPAFDGRGAPFRRVVGRIDIGAVEVGQVVDTLVDESDGDFSAGDLSLREAIERLNADPLLYHIEFDPALTAGSPSSPATIALTMGELYIGRNAVIVGPGADRLIIDASGNDPTPAMNEGNGSRVLIIADGSGTADKEVLISGLTLTGADSVFGGAVGNEEMLTLRESVIAGNATTSNGGAVTNTGVLIVERSTLSGNFAGAGGAVTNLVQTMLIDSTISGNSATASAGGIDNFQSGDLTIARSTITDNSAGQLAGGLATQGNVSVLSSIIAGNHAANLDDVWGTLATSSNNILSGDPLLGPLADNGGPTPTHAVLPGSPALDAALMPLYHYPLNENLEDSLALGADLVPLGGVLTGEAYKFGANQGLQTQIPTSEAADYSLELWFKLDNVSASSGYRKLIDFSTPANPNAGLYLFNNRLRYVVDTVTGFYTGTQILTANTLHHVVLTRSGGPTVEINAYVDGVFDKTYPESFGGHTLAVFSEAGGGDTRVVRLFRSQNGFGPPGAGAVDRIRFYDHALGAAEVTEAFATAPLPDFDQRGAPFARQAGPGIDIGAFEVQTATLPGDFDSDGDVDGRDFLAWQRGQSPSPLSSDDLSDWQENYGVSQLSVVSSELFADEELDSPLRRNDRVRAESEVPASSMAPWAVSQLPDTRARGPCYDETMRDDSYVEQVDHAFEQLTTVPSRARGFGDMVARRGIPKRFDAGQLTRTF